MFDKLFSQKELNIYNNIYNNSINDEKLSKLGNLVICNIPDEIYNISNITYSNFNKSINFTKTITTLK